MLLSYFVILTVLKNCESTRKGVQGKVKGFFIYLLKNIRKI